MKKRTQPKEEPVVLGTRWTLPSGILGEYRVLHVRLPGGYAQAEGRYPVLFRLDGEERLFHPASGVVAYLSEWEARIPEMIVVGVANTDRLRDMLPTAVSLPNRRKHGGGGDRFLSFLAQEVIPFIEATYRTAPYRILSGTSTSGLAAMYAVFSKRPEFTAYLASSPTLSWDDRLVFRQLEALQQAEARLDASVFLFCGGDESRTIAADCRDLDAAWQIAPLRDLRWAYRVYEGEGHCPFEGFRDGLLWLFGPCKAPQECIEQGVAAVRNHYQALSSAYGYSVSISEAMYQDLARTWLGQGKVAEALEWLSDGCQAHPSSADLVFANALCLIRAERRDEARRRLREGVAKHPEHRDLVRLLERVEPA